MLQSFKIERDLLYKLRNLADKNNLTLNQYIVRLSEIAVENNYIEEYTIDDKKYRYIEEYIDFNPKIGEWLTTTQIKEKTKLDIPLNILGKLIKNTGVKNKITNGTNKYYILCKK